MERPAWVALQPSHHLGVLVGGIIVQNRVDELAGWHRRLDRVQEADELLMPVTLLAPANDGTVQHIRSREQGRGPVPLVVVGHGRRLALLHRQARPSAAGRPPLLCRRIIRLRRMMGPVERLDLRFLVHREHQAMRRRAHVEADDVAQLLDELRVLGQKARTRCGTSPCAFQMPCTALKLMPTALAIARPVQCVASPDGG